MKSTESNREIFLGISAHGLSNILRAQNRGSLILWLLLFLLAAGACCFFIVQNILTFYLHEVVTSIEVKSETVIKFPAVTFCYPNLHNFILNQSILNDLHQMYAEKSSSNQSFKDKYQEIAYLNHQINTNELKNSDLKHHYDETVLYCTFNGQECDYSDFQLSPLLVLNCMTFNGQVNTSKPKEIHDRGTGYGLDIQIYAGLSEDKSYDTIYTTRDMILIWVHESNKSPVYFKPIESSPGSHTSLAVSKSSVKKIPKPYSECEDMENYKNSKEYKMTLQIYKEYKQQYDAFIYNVKTCLQ